MNKNNGSVIIAGSGKPLFMLHGFLSSKEAFGLQIKFFSQYFKVIAYDLCGFGANKEMPFAYSLSDYVSELLSFVNQEEERPYVLAHSFGCRVAVKAQAEYDCFDRLALCGMAGLKPAPSLKRMAKSCVYRLIRPYLNQSRLERLFFSKDYNSVSGVMKSSFKLVVSEHLDKQFSTIKIPVLCVFGEKDNQTPPQYLTKRIKKLLPHGQTHIISDADHFCFLQKPNQFNNLIKEFLL